MCGNGFGLLPRTKRTSSSSSSRDFHAPAIVATIADASLISTIGILGHAYLVLTTRCRHKSPLRGNQDAEPMNSKPSSNDNDSMRPNVGEDRPSLSPSRHLAASKDPEKNIDDIENLSLSQNRIEDPAADAQSSPRSFNPLKRGAGGESDQPEPPADHSPGRQFSTNRRNKAIPGGSSTGKEKDKDPDFNRSDSRASESRNPTGSTVKRLFDPSTGSPSTSSAYRRGKEEPSIQTRRLYDARPHVLRSRKAPTGDKGDASTKSMTNLDNNYNGQQFKKIENFTSLPVKLGNGSHSIKNDQINPAMENDEESEPFILLQPETRPISHDQLVVEVKGIYAGLVMVEAKCIDLDEKQSHAAQEKDPSRRSKLSDEQWQALIALHKTLLHEHHDFFLASQHPSASPALSRLAAKYSMPARMWRHGIHAFLEVLRHRLPESLDHMLAFIYIAYSMMALLYETVSTFEDTWIECLGDLGRYRMAIEDDNIRDREIWSNVARFWYCKAADKSPEVGRLYHHLAILARPYTLLQLSHYTRSLTCVIPFDNARGSIMTLFTPILNGKESAYHRSSSLETIFIKAHGLLFSARPFEEFDATVRQITDGVLDSYIGRVTAKFKEQGVFAAVANIAALFEYGSLRQPGVPRSIFRLAFDEVRMLKIQESKSVAHQLSDNLFDVNDAITRSSSANSTQLNLEKLTSSEVQSSVNHISHASNLAFGTLLICLQRIGDKNVLPLVHVYFVFFMSLAAVEKAMVYVEKGIPWREICSFLNSLANPEALTSRVVGEAFPKPDDGVGRPLPEDFIMRGQMYTQWYFPETWFKDAIIDDEERSLELPSMAAIRVERILWLGFHIASVGQALHKGCIILIL